MGCVPIETLEPGDLVFTHTGLARPVRRLIRRAYEGELIGIRHAASAVALWVAADQFVLCRERRLRYGTPRAWGEVPPENFGRTRQLRRASTPAERALWQALRGAQLGVKFRRQHPIGPYVADFYAREAALVVELDSDSHATDDAQAYDAARTAYLNALGLDVLRFSNRQVRETRAAVLEAIHAAATAVRAAEVRGQQWRHAGTLRPEDIVFTGIGQPPAGLVSVARIEAREEVCGLEVDVDQSFVTEAAVVHSGCGSSAVHAISRRGANGP